MLKKIPSNLSPDIVKYLMEMGHGDEIVIADGNFPSYSTNSTVVSMQGNTVCELLESITELIPLNTDIKYNAFMMKPDQDAESPTIWDQYKSILSDSKARIELLGRDDFYERCKKAYVIISTSDKALYANVILNKGCL